MEEDEVEKYVKFTEASMSRLRDKRRMLRKKSTNENMEEKSSQAQQQVVKGWQFSYFFELRGLTW